MTSHLDHLKYEDFLNSRHPSLMVPWMGAIYPAAGGAGASGYAVDNSALFNDDDNQYLIRENASNSTTGGADARKKFTVSLWWKHGNIPSGGQNLFIQRNSSSNYVKCGIAGSGGNEGALQFFSGTLGVFSTGDSTAVLRDHHAWYHILFYYDSTDGTAGDRARIYLNGVRLTDFQTSATNPSSGAITQFGSNNAMVINQQQGGSQYGDGYMAEMVVIDGQALEPSSFTEFDDNGVLRPLDISKQGFTFGDQGFYLPFTDSNYLGADYQSGSGVGTAITAAAEWNGDTSDFSSLATDIVAIGGNQGAIRTNKTFTGDFAFDFTWKGGANPAYVGVYEIDEDGTFSTGSSDGGMGSMTDSFYLYFAGSNVVNALKGSSTEASSIFTAASSEVVKFQRSGSQFKVYEDGVLRHTFTGTSANEVRILIGQSSSSLDWENFRWTNGSTSIGGGFQAVNSPTQSSDSPTKNSATITPLFKPSTQTLSHGNLRVTATGNNNGRSFSSMAIPSTGKWYFEVKMLATGQHMAGVIGESGLKNLTTSPHDDAAGFTYHMGTSQTAFNNGNAISPALDSSDFSANDILGVAVDMDANKLWFARNNSWYNSGNPAAGSGEIYSTLTEDAYFATARPYGSGKTIEFNFGATDFSYTPPSGFSGWNTTTFFEASAPAIEDGSAHFQATTYTGNGGANEINQSGNSTFQPDFVWLKDRGGAHHALIDAVRGADKGLYSSLDFVEYTESNLSFDADGFSMTTTGSAATINTSSNNYVGWQWLAGNSTASNSNGSITSTVSVNQTAGFSIVTYTGTGSAATVGHGLNAVPEWILTKKRVGGAVFWAVYHAANTSAPETEYLKLNTTDNTTDDAGYWNDTAPTSSVFSINNESAVNTLGHTYVAYCWCGKPGFSKFGSYEGGYNSTNGAYVNLGFSPAWLMIKNIDNAGENWFIFDNQRPGYNDENNQLIANSNSAEGSGNILDLLSNGFKIRANDRAYGGSATQDTYIYMALAEHPFAGTTPATAR